MVGAKAETMINELISTVSEKSIQNFIRQQNRSFIEQTEDLSYLIPTETKFSQLTKLGEIEYADTNKLLVFSCRFVETRHASSLHARSARKMQFEIAKKALSADFKDGAVFVFYDAMGRFRFSFIRRNYGDKEQKFSNWKRFTYFVEPDAKTNRTFIERVGGCKFDSLDAIQQAFSVEKLTKDFYKELSDWYFWAIKNVSFPNDVNDDADDQKYNSENIIRLITRLIFAWFLKQKDLIKPELFDPAALSGILNGFDAESETQNNYYRAILQNLFFATLNQEIGKRGFAADKGFLQNRTTNNIKNLYRYENEFRDGTAQVMQLFSKVPFLNGGLFECLDQKKKDGKNYDWDGFSRNSKHQANIPNVLFFGKERKVDLSGEYNDKKMKAVKVSGIIEILNRYNFTVEENTPVEVEVALDPELLGKVFENLLGAFNPETQETARKQTGSFYTPREIVNYMVDESLIAYFKTQVPDLPEETLRLLFSYDDQEVAVDDTLRQELIHAAFHCKILDPACGSGAFPMGILQQMVHVLKKLDPDNLHWNNVVLAQAMKDIENTQQISDEDKDGLLAEIESTFDKGVNYPDYARKLHLIENCIYGVDIQTIAVQISKLRFFISLVCEQNHTNDASDNFGIRPLPNLETKFVAANTLICSEKVEEDKQLFDDDRIKKLVDKLTNLRHRLFLVTNATEKSRLHEKDAKLRADIEHEVTQLYVKHNDDNKALYEQEKARTEKELELIDRTVVRSTVSTNIFGETITNTYKPNEKRRKELSDAIKTLTLKIEEAGGYNRLGAVARLAQQLTSWNPYDQNTSSDFFDPEWMFGLKEGFDVVIGNPPYVFARDSAAKGITQAAKDYYYANYSLAEYQVNLYPIFIEAGSRYLTKQGVLCFITPNNWLTINTNRKLRQFILAQSNVSIINFYARVFESADLDAAIVLFQIGNTNSKTENVRLLEWTTEPELIVDQQKSYFFSQADYIINIEALKSGETIDLVTKIEKGGRPLKEFASVKCGLGAYGRGDGIPPQTDEMIKERIYHSKTKEGEKWFKYVEGVDVKRYLLGWIREEYLKWGKHLREPRNDWRLFSTPRILVRQIPSPPPYCINACFTEETFLNDRNSMNIINISINPLLVLAFLNSRLMSYWFIHKFGKMQRGIFPQFKINELAIFPMPRYFAPHEERLIVLVDNILSAKAANFKADTSQLEKQIDELVYKLYDLSYEEVLVVDKDFWLSEEEYEQITIE